MILTPLQKLPNNVGNLGKLSVATSFEWLPKVQKIAQSGHTEGITPLTRVHLLQKFTVPIKFNCITLARRKFGQCQTSKKLICKFGIDANSQKCVPTKAVLNRTNSNNGTKAFRMKTLNNDSEAGLEAGHVTSSINNNFQIV